MSKFFQDLNISFKFFQDLTISLSKFFQELNISLSKFFQELNISLVDRKTLFIVMYILNNQ